MAKKRTRFDAKKRKPTLRARGPRSQALPGLEQVRSVKLDHLCESIGEIREKMNELRANEKTEKNSCLIEMRKRELTAYIHAGVELARVPGEEKLRVRATKNTASAANIGDPEDDETLAAERGLAPGAEE